MVPRLTISGPAEVVACYAKLEPAASTRQVDLGPPGRGGFSVIHLGYNAARPPIGRQGGPWRRFPAGGRTVFHHVYFLSRSSSSIEIPCGPRMKQMRTPGRVVVGSLVNSTPLALISAATASISFTLSPR